jgi:hypothetical protein
MRTPLLRTLAGTLALTAALLLARNAAAMQILVPAYFYPDPAGGSANLWQALADSAASVPITAILNPASGPGAVVDPNYSNAVSTLRSAGGKVVAYVSTAYGTRDAQLVAEEIDRYASFYDIDGFFLDEMSNASDRLDYYVGLRDHIRGMNPGYRIIGNAGTNTLASYLTVADTLVTFENAAGYEFYQVDPWANAHEADRFAHLLYDVADASAMQRAVSLAAQRNVGYLYVTDDDGVNPWDRLPTYWQAEVATISTVPLPGTLGLLAGAIAALAAWFRRTR